MSSPTCQKHPRPSVASVTPSRCPPTNERTRHTHHQTTRPPASPNTHCPSACMPPPRKPHTTHHSLRLHSFYLTILVPPSSSSYFALHPIITIIKLQLRPRPSLSPPTLAPLTLALRKSSLTPVIRLLVSCFIVCACCHLKRPTILLSAASVLNNNPLIQPPDSASTVSKVHSLAISSANELSPNKIARKSTPLSQDSRQSKTAYTRPVFVSCCLV